MTEKIYFENLPQNEQNILTQIYGSQIGYSVKKILYVEELSEHEKIFFDKDNFTSPSFFVQKLYKVAGNILPLKFNLAVSKLIEKTDALRTNYCSTGSRTLKIIFDAKNELPEIVYRNLSNVPDIDDALKNILEADMRRAFDLRHDNLIRFSVFHTGTEEYAVLVTLPQIIAESFEIKNLFRSVFGLELLPPQIKIPNVESSIASITNYWEKIFKNLPETSALPFEKKAAKFSNQNSYRMTIPLAVMSDLREKAKSNKIMLMSIFQSAWAILLQEFNNSRDTAFSVLIQNRITKDVNNMPVRFKSEDETSVQNLVDRQFKQVIISQPYACKDFSAIKKMFRLPKNTFDYFLSFNDFMENEQLYSEATAAPDGEFVLQNSWNAQNTKLGIYFHYKENTTSISILYDKNRFADNFGELLARRYYLILQQMLLDWNLNYADFMERLRDRFTIEPSPKENDENFLRNFISQITLLQGTHQGNIQKLANLAKLKTYFEGDRISGAEIENNLIFVAEGKLARSIETGDGWYNTLDIVKENRWINETVLLKNRKVKMSAEILTDKAILMTIPLDGMEKFLKLENGVENKILNHVLGELEKYQRLWVQS